MLLVTAVALASVGDDRGGDLAGHVDVFVGTRATGNTFPGATVPFGKVQLTPVMAQKGWNFNSGYHRTGAAASSRLTGFGHTALSGTGLNDGGDFALLPAQLRSRCLLLHNAAEKGEPGFYTAQVQCLRGGPVLGAVVSEGVTQLSATVSAAATRHGGMWKFEYGSEERSVHIDMRTPLDRFVTGSVERSGESTASGWRRSAPTHHCATEHTAFWHAEASERIVEVRGSPIRGDFELVFANGTDPILLRVGLSHVDSAGAVSSVALDVRKRFGWDFNAVVAAARADWNDALGRVVITADDDVVKRFYTALYHVFLGPTLFSDPDGRYALGNKQGKLACNPAERSCGMYSTFSLWDTYRAQQPLLTYLYPELTDSFVGSLLAIAQDSPSHRLPRWVLFGKETGCMSGYPAAVVIADGILKQLVTGERAQDALGASIRTADQEPHVSRGVPIPSHEGACVSRALEAAVADMCIARAAEKLGDSGVARRFRERGGAWKHYFNGDSGGLLLPVSPRGHFMRPDPDQPGGGYEEGTPRQYSFMVPHAAADLAGSLNASGLSLEASLDKYFYGIKFKPAGPGNQDVETGIFGGHTQGNEPGHHTPFLYNTAGVPWKTQRIVEELQSRMYKTGADGLPGNDDVGQTSAWFVWVALGLYPVDPCGEGVEVGRPLVRTAEVGSGDGTLFTITVDKQGPGFRYVGRVQWNGKNVGTTLLRHADLMAKGGDLRFSMSPDPVDFRSGVPQPPPKPPPPPPPATQSARRSSAAEAAAAAARRAAQAERQEPESGSMLTGAHIMLVVGVIFIVGARSLVKSTPKAPHQRRRH